MAGKDYMANINSTVDSYANVMAKAKANADAGVENATNFHVPLVGWKISKGPFKDEKKIAAYQEMQQTIRDVGEILRKARQTLAQSAGGTSNG